MKKKEKEDCVFELLEHAVAHNLRCPTNSDIATILRRFGVSKASAGSVPSITNGLVKQGRIVVRVYGNNWRTVTICAGPYSDRSTLPPPHGGRPHIILDAKELERRQNHVSRHTLED